MNQTTDEELYSEYAESFLKGVRMWVGESVNATEGLDESTKEALIDDLVFNLATLLDGTGNLEHKGKVMVPYLGLKVSDENENVVFPEDWQALHNMLEV